MDRLPRAKAHVVAGMVLLSICSAGEALAQSDPGVRAGAAAAGGALPGLSATELSFFKAAADVFAEIDTVPSGLGPRFNLDSCAGCHAQPAIGGTSPVVNPQIAVANAAHNAIPSFVTANGPVREARFVTAPNGSPDGGVHDLFVITGRSDAAGCNIQQPNFAAQVAANNVIFRIPTPTFGLGLVENTRDSELVSASASIAAAQSALGITSGFFNHSGNDGTITRFGWKAQNKSLMLFAGEAYNVEQGVTNEVFPTEREEAASCQLSDLPEDGTHLVAAVPSSGSVPSDFNSDVVNFAVFMRFMAPPAPAPTTTSISTGLTQFTNIGCANCHISQHATAASPFTGQSNVTYRPFSDFALHNMGTGLQDRVSQGNANGGQFRTAPLWGLGQRIFFLHDGRTSDLLATIAAHAGTGSEANAVISNFNLLSATNRQNILNFLRSL
jgi:CxxC motif-containing protein (DUF1111 family)